MFNKKKFQEWLLHSGLPLEASILKILLKKGFEDSGEVEFRRDGKIFSSDIGAYHYRNLSEEEPRSLVVNLIVESKYKSKDKAHSWVFVKFSGEEDNLRHEARNEFFDDMISLDLSKKLDLHKLHFKFSTLETANKGVDIFPGGVEPNVIREAVTQATLGAISVHFGMIRDIITLYQIGDLGLDTIGDPLVALTIPIIVTNADIYLVKKEIDLKDIEEIDDVEKLVTTQKGIALINHEYSLSREYCENFIKENPIDIPKEIKNLIQKNRSFINSLPFKSIHPGIVYIINFKYLEEFLDELREVTGMNKM